jgi:1-acyl-sn-glycerol-3-phosphate acyltransferase
LQDLRETATGKPEAFRTSGGRAAISATRAAPSEPLLPSAEELAVLSPFERFAFRVTHRMNLGRWKRFWTWCQSFFGAGWIHISTYNLMRVYGLEHVEAVDHSRPLLLVANHRSFFDMYVVSTTLFRKTPWRKQLFFPVRGRFYYQNPLGMFVNPFRRVGFN